MIRAPTFVTPPFLARVAAFGAVVSMAAWNAYICLRLRPDAGTVLINLSFWIVPVLVLLALTGRAWRSLALGTAFTFVFQRLHWLKWKYLFASWTAADFRMLSDAANWVLVEQYPELLAFAVACIVVLVAIWLLTPRGSVVQARWRGAAALLAIVLVGGTVSLRDLHSFDPFGFNVYGHFASLVYSVPTLEYQAPAIAADSSHFLARAALLPPLSVDGAPAKPDIVIWLQESTMDLALIDVPEARLPALRMYQPDGATREHGLMRVHAWGGSTWLSEFALLTGLPAEDFGPSAASVYYTVTSRVRFTLPKLLKSLGYRSIAISGSPKGIYNMERAQRDLGFDEVLNPLDFPEWGGKSLATHYASDAQLGQFALQILQRRHDQPTLLFVLSIMQHGPYRPDSAVAYGLDRTTLDVRTAARLSDFAARMVDTSEACVRFGAALLARPRPVVFAYFGDHQPNLEGELPLRQDLDAPRYTTSYALKTNVDVAPLGGGPVLDVSYLAAMILQHAGIALDPFFSANRAMRLLCHGRLVDCRDQPLRESYRAYLYADLGAAERLR